MKMIISPARDMRCSEEISMPPLSVPAFLGRTEQILRELRTYQPWELEMPMKIKEKLAVQTYMEYQDMNLKKQGVPAILSYDGLVYKYIKADTFDTEDLQFVNEHLRILSAFYGVLHPLDGIHPYRLELINRIKISGQTLYQFWENIIFQKLYEVNEPVVNLASEEYAKCIRKYLMPHNSFIDIEFYVMRGGRLKTITTWAKMARGQMVRYAVQNRITRPEELKKFEWDAYEFRPSLSHEYKYVFVKS